MEEKSRARYITLACDHLTDWETVQRYSAWQRDKRLWCEECSKWKPVKKKPVAKDESNDPLF